MSTNNNNNNGNTPNPTGGAAPAASPVVTMQADPSASKSKVSVETRYQTLIAGLLANFGEASTFPLPMGTFTREELVASLQKKIVAAEAAKSAKTAWHTAVEAERQVDADTAPLRKQLQQTLAGRFGAASVKMAEFGFAPARPRKVSAKTKAAAVVKVKATRQARGTLGKKQKKSVKGGVTGVVLTPVTATQPIAPSPSTAAKPAS